MVRLLLIRHAATAVSGKNTLLGSTDIDASGDGLQQLSRLPELLQDHSPSVWYCSPLKRALQTAEKIGVSGLKDIQFFEDDRLREIHFGCWENKGFADIEREAPELIPAWSKYENFVFPEGEAVADFVDRVQDFLKHVRGTKYKEIGIITHGGVIRTMICLALGLDVRNYLLFSVSPASLTILDLYSEGGILTGLNL